MTTILMTRPEKQAHDTAKTLREQGHTVIIESLVTIVPQVVTWPDLKIYDAIILTSSTVFTHTISGAADYFLPPNLKETCQLWCVGNVTAQHAYNAGFPCIKIAQGNGASLVEKLIKTYQNTEKRLLYLSGDPVFVPIHEILTGHYIDCDHLVVYQSQPVTSFSLKLVDLFHAGGIQWVFLYSTVAAKTFKKCWEQTQCRLQHVMVLCKSHSISEVVITLPWKNIFIADDMAVPHDLISLPGEVNK